MTMSAEIPTTTADHAADHTADHTADHSVGAYGADMPLGKLAAMLRTRGVKVHTPDRAPGPRRVPVLVIEIGGRKLQVWLSSLGDVFLAGVGVSIGAAGEPALAADQAINLLRTPRRRT